MKIFDLIKDKVVGYYLFIIMIVLSINLTILSFGQELNPSVDFASNSPVVQSVEQEDEKTIAEIKKEFREQNKENVASPLRIFSNLFVLILIMLVLAWLYKKYGKNFLDKTIDIKGLNKNTINILSSLPVGQNKYLHVIKVGDERMLIGVTNTNISLIKTLDNITEEKAVSDE